MTRPYIIEMDKSEELGISALVCQSDGSKIWRNRHPDRHNTIEAPYEQFSGMYSFNRWVEDDVDRINIVINKVRDYYDDYPNYNYEFNYDLLGRLIGTFIITLPFALAGYFIFL